MKFIRRVDTERKRFRIPGIALALALVAGGCAVAQVEGQGKSPQRDSAEPSKYPPYPEVWDRVPGATVESIGLLNFRLLDNGDVLVSTYGAGEQHRAFFTGSTFSSVEDALGGRIRTPDDHYQIETTAGKVVSAISGQECLRGLGSGVRVYDSKVTVSRSTTLVWVLDQPRERREIRCEMQDQPSFRSPLVLLETNKLFPLSDGSLLVADRELGIVVRVQIRPNGTLCSKSPLLGHKLFLTDTEWVVGKHREFSRSHAAVAPVWAQFLNSLQADLRTNAISTSSCNDEETK